MALTYQFLTEGKLPFSFIHGQHSFGMVTTHKFVYYSCTYLDFYIKSEFIHHDIVLKIAYKHVNPLVETLIAYKICGKVPMHNLMEIFRG